MTNRITLIIMFISIALLTYVAFNGIEVGSFEVLSVVKLQEKNDVLDEKIEKANELNSKDYQDNIEKFEKTFSNYLVQKQKYNQLTELTDNKEDNMYETKQYDIAYLWKVLGKYANNRSVILAIDVQKADKIKSLYNFNFKITGRYAKISQFITDIENDSDLYFRIYDFKMTPMNGKQSNVTASFSVRSININPTTIK